MCPRCIFLNFFYSTSTNIFPKTSILVRGSSRKIVQGITQIKKYHSYRLVRYVWWYYPRWSWTEISRERPRQDIRPLLPQCHLSIECESSQTKIATDHASTVDHCNLARRCFSSRREWTRARHESRPLSLPSSFHRMRIKSNRDCTRPHQDNLPLSPPSSFHRMWITSNRDRMRLSQDSRPLSLWCVFPSDVN